MNVLRKKLNTYFGYWRGSPRRLGYVMQEVNQNGDRVHALFIGPVLVVW